MHRIQSKFCNVQCAHNKLLLLRLRKSLNSLYQLMHHDKVQRFPGEHCHENKNLPKSSCDAWDSFADFFLPELTQHFRHYRFQYSEVFL